MDVEIWAAADIMQRISCQPAFAGIVQKPLFTNIDGGIGLFFFPCKGVQDVQFSTTTLDSLWEFYLQYGWVDFRV